MSQTQPPYSQQPGYAPYPPQPQKKSHTVRNVLLGIVLLMVLFVGGCLALVGGVLNEADKAIKESDSKAGGAKNPLTITEGEAFEVDGFKYAAGWQVGPDPLGDIRVSGLRVTNEREDSDGAITEIKFWRGKEVVAMTDCSTEQIQVGTTTKVDCISADNMPKKYDRITINDTF